MHRFVRRVSMSALVAPLLLCGTAGASYPKDDRPFNAHVQVLALVSSTHQVYAGDQQNFVAALLGKDGTEEPVLLVDQFRAAGDPIKPSLLRGHAKFGMRLTRQERCDHSAAETYTMLDPLKTYDAGVLEGLKEHGPAILPCFMVDHEQTRVKH